MAANKFATMVHRNTNKITLILIYAVLEWTLIILLLLNSLFSYLIIKFADYFGLKPPCLWCSRVDHFFEPDKKDKNLHRDLLCQEHAAEISRLGYCSNHQKLAAAEDMCEDCSSSRPDFLGASRSIDFFSWGKHMGVIQADGDKAVENGELGLKCCSCCGVSLEDKIYSPYIVIDPTWGVLDYTQKGNLIAKPRDDHHHHDVEDGDKSDRSRSDDHYIFEEKLESRMLSDATEGFGERELEAGEDCSLPVPKFGLKEMEGDDEKVYVVLESENEDEKVGVVLESEKEVVNKDYLNMIVENSAADETLIQVCSREEDVSFEIQPQHHLEFFVDCSGHQLVPIELINLKTESGHRVEEDEEYTDYQQANLVPELVHVEEHLESVEEDKCSAGEGEAAAVSVPENAKDLNFILFESMEMEETENSLVFHTKERSSEEKREAAVISVPEDDKEPNFILFESMEMEETENSLVFHTKECGSEEKLWEQVAVSQATETPLWEQFAVTQATETPSQDVDDNIAVVEEGERDSDVPPVSEEVFFQISTNVSEPDVSIGTEIPDLDPADEIQGQDTHSSYLLVHEDPSTSSNILHRDVDFGSEKTEEETVELKSLAVEVREHTMNNLSSEFNEIEEEKVPDTPTSSESLNQLQKKLLVLERKESGTEESLDGSVMSEFEGGDAVMTVERLTSALRAERKALNALYSELEEERSASAVAASQTMAMINRLQEEKAAMQMEALQYQRMMEEQSEYDQEALQLLNELMVKREKEKQEVEKELELYRRKVLDYETKEKMRTLRRSKDSSARSGTSCASFSNTEDSDGLSVDLNQEVKEEDTYFSHHETDNLNTPVDAVLNLEDPLADFEGERLSILQQLKLLEEKLFTLSDEEEQHYQDIRPTEDFHEQNGKHSDQKFDFCGEEANGVTNGFYKHVNGKHHNHEDRRIISSKQAKRLLPLFDAITSESEDGLWNGHENGFDHDVTSIELENKRVGIEDEVDQLYERLQALEADREFLRHCISSLKKGDKGVDLLQEILQHLRDLRNVDIRVKNMGDGALT